MSSIMSTFDEAARLQTLFSLGMLDTEPEAEFDELVQLASTICETPISLVTLVDEQRQWFKATMGLSVRETRREVSFCAHAILRPELFVVEDASKDARFAQNPLVTGDPSIRFYAGMPLQTPNGHPMGTLCVIDTIPRQLSPNQTAALLVLANQVKVRMELRLQRRALEDALQAKERFAAELQTSDQRFRLFMDHSPFVSYMKDEDGRFVFYNRRFAERFGIAMQEWIGKCGEDLFPPAIADVFRANDNAILASRQGREVTEHSLEHGQVYIWRSHKFPFMERDGRQMVAGVSVDITGDVAREEELKLFQSELESANSLLRDLAVTDALTGLSNRRAFEERFAIEFSQSARRHRPLTLVVMDIDNFKQVNDSYGHGAGDAVLRKVAQVLRETTRLPDMAARYGGEEFIVILPDTDVPQAMLWADRLHAALARADWPYRSITMSMGVAGLDEEIREMGQLVARADEALYESKRAGKSRATIWMPAVTR
ncbi:PAS domain S-box-containing protein/diguanylate cyclase (GGDEF) domain-containing protein [Granulicella rosea]|uniref:diguanylate cyclase n=1 Tax=Granulicella rosea TaxID=474952 RepID=A0A239KA86_9BACT|nr:diguanylate cyclase [Granulicella rosea]SNT15356.1 PAS domain S-box-containing protein/diguanylate cyclase (GGDEF) domain-containing protein [Granulicella rosea]